MMRKLAVVLAFLFVWLHFGSQAVSADIVVKPQKKVRLLIKHVVYLNGDETLEVRKSIRHDLDREVERDIATYKKNGIEVFTDSQDSKTFMATRMWQYDHLEVPPPAIKPRE